MRERDRLGRIRPGRLLSVVLRLGQCQRLFERRELSAPRRSGPEDEAVLGLDLLLLVPQELRECGASFCCSAASRRRRSA